MREADKVFVILQSILELSIVLSYVVLFVLFLKVIHRQSELTFMKRNVIQFFVFMLAVLTVQLLFNLIFYLSYSPREQTDDPFNEKQKMYRREQLNNLALYVHSGIELVFNLVILSYLIA